jgi:hypothetical protein
MRPLSEVSTLSLAQEGALSSSNTSFCGIILSFRKPELLEQNACGTDFKVSLSIHAPFWLQ